MELHPKLRAKALHAKTKITIWVTTDNARSVRITSAAAQGLRRLGYQCALYPSTVYRKPVGDIAVFYGLAGNLLPLYRAYRMHGRTTILVDLGYWERKPVKDRIGGYHKVVVNGLQPSLPPGRVYPSDRFDRLNVALHPFVEKPDAPFLVAGMSGKAASVYNLAPEQWERETIAEIRAQSRRHIVYRPKPSSAAVNQWSRDLGDTFSDAAEPYNIRLQGSFATISHHSNVALDGLVFGIPCFVKTGITESLSGDWNNLDKPFIPTDDQRRVLCNAAAYHQWTPKEMSSGIVWEWLSQCGDLP